MSEKLRPWLVQSSAAAAGARQQPPATLAAGGGGSALMCCPALLQGGHTGRGTAEPLPAAGEACLCVWVPRGAGRALHHVAAARAEGPAAMHVRLWPEFNLVH